MFIIPMTDHYIGSKQSITVQDRFGLGCMVLVGGNVCCTGFANRSKLYFTLCFHEKKCISNKFSNQNIIFPISLSFGAVILICFRVNLMHIVIDIT